MVKSLEHRIQGIPISPSPDPTPIRRPWFNIVAGGSLSNAGTETIVTVADLYTQIGVVAGLSGFSEIRIRELRIWGSAGGNLTAIIANPITGGELHNARDLGNLNGRPRIGYIYPLALATSPLLTSANQVFRYTASPAATGGASVGEYHMLCQFR
jgi:hypothetical protein